MRKRIIIGVLAVSMLLTLAVGCADSSDSGASETQSADDSASETVTTSDSAESGKFVILDESLAVENYGIGFRKEDTELRDTVDAALKVLKADGTVEKISTEWFGEDITTIKSDANALDDITVEERTFILGLDDSFPPMGYRDSSNNVIGFDIDLANAVCDYLGWTLEVQPIDWSAKEMELETENIDCIWNGMTLTEEREETMSCSEPYMANGQVLVVLADSGYETSDDLAGKSIALQSGSSAEEALDSNADFKDSLDSANTFPNNLQCFMDLEQGGVDAVLVDSIVANWYITTGNAEQ